MENINLTKDSKKLFSVLYRQYRKKVKSGTDKTEARQYGTSHDIHKNLVPKWSFEDVENACHELNHTGLVQCHWYDNTAHLVTLTDLGIIYKTQKLQFFTLEYVITSVLVPIFIAIITTLITILLNRIL